jgi:hypothetical protein
MDSERYITAWRCRLNAMGVAASMISLLGLQLAGQHPLCTLQSYRGSRR